MRPESNVAETSTYAPYGSRERPLRTTCDAGGRLLEIAFRDGSAHLLHLTTCAYRDDGLLATISHERGDGAAKRLAANPQPAVQTRSAKGSIAQS